jgi:hypothetical protein
MDNHQNLIIRKATSAEDTLIARHFYQLWLDNNCDRDTIKDEWLEVTLEFINKARQELFFQGFVAAID